MLDLEAIKERHERYLRDGNTDVSLKILLLGKDIPDLIKEVKRLQGERTILREAIEGALPSILDARACYQDARYMDIGWLQKALKDTAITVPEGETK